MKYLIGEHKKVGGVPWKIAEVLAIEILAIHYDI